MRYLIIPFFLISFLSTHSQDKMVSELIIKGNKKTKTSFIKLITKLKINTHLDSTILEKDIKRLKRLPCISHAYYQVFRSHDNNYRVFYHIKENFTIIPVFNFYPTNQGELAYRLGLYEFNFLGRNITIGGYYLKDIYDSYGINFRAPYLFSNKFGLALNHQNLTTQEPVFLSNGEADYKYNNTSYEILGLYELNFKNRFEIGVNSFKEKYDYKFGATSDRVPQNLEVNKLLFKSLYEYNNLNFNYQYVEGVRSNFNLQYVLATKDHTLPNFLIGVNDLHYFIKVGEKGNWANRLRLGLATNNDTPFAPFSVDNNINIRGVGNTVDRGTGVIVLNTEYRHTLIDKKWFVMQSNTFLDMGTWRKPGGNFSDFTDANNIKIYPGLGVRFIHKYIYNAVLRIDYGYGISKNASKGLVFGIRQYF